MHVLLHVFGGHACESTWLQIDFPIGVYIDVNFILAFVKTGCYVSRMSTHYTFTTVYKERHCH